MGELKRAARRGRTRERVQAIGEIGRVSDPDVIREWALVEFLLGLTLERDPRIAWKSVSALGQMAMGAGSSVARRLGSPFVELLRDPDRHVLIRMQAATELGRMVTGEAGETGVAVNALVRLATPGPEVPPELAAEVLPVLGSIGDARGADAILKGLIHRHPLVRRAALKALSRALGGPDAKRFLTARTGTQLLGLLLDKGTSREGRQCAIAALRKAIDAGHRIPDAESVLVKILREEKHPGTLTSALGAIGAVASPKAARPVAELYRRFNPKGEVERGGDAGSEVRAEACATAGELLEFWGRKRDVHGSVGAARMLTDLLVSALTSDTSDLVRQEAAIALGSLYDRRYDKAKAIAALVVVVGAEDVSENVKNAALDSLKILSCRGFETPDRWARWFEENAGRLRGVAR
ncbi:MAG: HEAT repeat domain-containing protein [Planctomycetota bacterium]